MADNQAIKEVLTPESLDLVMQDLTIQELMTKLVLARDRKEEIAVKAARATEPMDMVIKAIDRELFRRKVIDGVKNYAIDNVGTYTWANTQKIKVDDFEGFLEFAKAHPDYQFVDSKVNEAALKKFVEENPDTPLEFATFSNFIAPRFTKAKAK